MVAIVEGPKLAALSCGKAAYLVVLLHGEGSDGQSIIDAALNWAPTMPKADFVALEAPFASPGGGRRWFETDGFDPAAVDAGLRTTAPLLDQLLTDMLSQRRLPDSHLALVGFSQGAILALRCAITRAQPMAAVVSFSGALFDGAGSEAEVRSKPPMLMIHGDADPLIPIDAMRATKDWLKAAGVPVKSMKRAGLGHQMDDDGVIAAGDFLTALVMHKPAAAADDHAHDHDHDHDHEQGHDHARHETHEDHERH